MGKAEQISLQILEIILLVPAFGLLVPEVPSEAGHVYHLFPTLFFAALFFILSQTVSLWRDRRPWWPAILKLILFLGYGWLVFERFAMGPMK